MSATQRELLEDRWNLLLRDVARFDGEAGISTVNSKRQRRIDRAFEELGALLVDEVADNETDSLSNAVTDIWTFARQRLLDWAEMIEEGRADYRRRYLEAAAVN